MFKTIKNALKTPDVRKKLLYTLVLIIIFRFGCFITVPGVDTIALGEQMQSATGSLTGLINTITSLLNNNDGDNYCYNVSAEEKARMERTAKRNGLEKDTKSYLYNIRDYRILYEYCLKRKIKLFNCSGQTVIDSIPRLHYESVISKGKDDSDEK